MEEIFNNQSELLEEQNDTETTDNVVELTDELADNHLSEIGLGDDTESDKESEKKPKEDKLSAYEKAVLAEMERRANEGDALVASALKSGDKNIHDCWRYVTAQAKKKAVNGCAMIEDAVVFGWAHHYYIEPKEVINAELKTKSTPKADTPKPQAKKKAKKPERQKENLNCVNVPMIRPTSTRDAKKGSREQAKAVIVMDLGLDW